jgi:light-regulated signal transduction histidine kinase (bacteriophytochrome)
MWEEKVHSEDIAMVYKAFSDTVPLQKSFSFEFRVQNAITKQYEWFYIKAVPRFESGEFTGFIGTGININEQKAFAKELELQVGERTKELEASNIELEKMNKELQSFAYISCHDLQEPLRKILTFASRITAKEDDNLSDYGKDMFNRMPKAAKRMQTLIQDLLTYSRTASGDRKFENTDLNKIIEEVSDDLKEDLKDKHAAIESSELCEANVIPFQFRQLMYNLIGNSLKLSNPELPLCIKIKSKIMKGSKSNNDTLSPQKKFCHISVSNNGIGFEPQYSEKIFEVFQRLNGKNEYNGTGIGLSIVKKIVENHAGIITAKSEIDKGPTFDIYIPAK